MMAANASSGSGRRAAAPRITIRVLRRAPSAAAPPGAAACASTRTRKTPWLRPNTRGTTLLAREEQHRLVAGWNPARRPSRSCSGRSGRPARGTSASRRAALQIRPGLERDDGLDPLAVVAHPARIDHAAVDDDLRARDDLAELRRHSTVARSAEREAAIANSVKQTVENGRIAAVYSTSLGPPERPRAPRGRPALAPGAPSFVALRAAPPMWRHARVRQDAQRFGRDRLRRERVLDQLRHDARPATRLAIAYVST